MSVFTKQVEHELKNSYTSLSENHYHTIKQLLQQHEIMVNALKDIANNFDCDADAHRHDTTCRKCMAQEKLNQIGE
ncbi:hypothetical protein [Paenibacillus sp. FSL R10-2771]|uniref:hypothetical protein n=1 Tax=Paenibacillus sp. FSL R10-2771 TaxID=2954693 RepID=UPI0030F97CE6